MTSSDNQKGHRAQLRARFLADDSSATPDYELLELLLFSTVPQVDTKPRATAATSAENQPGPDNVTGCKKIMVTLRLMGTEYSTRLLNIALSIPSILSIHAKLPRFSIAFTSNCYWWHQFAQITQFSASRTVHSGRILLYCVPTACSHRI